ncbi:hypothetical protein [Leptothoe kymatousa]|nr:hypothetical protein [Leptothoe kymatousa]
MGAAPKYDRPYTETIMNSERTFNLGFCSLRFDNQVIDRMLSYLNIPYHSHLIKNITPESTRDIDTLFALNPTFDDEQLEHFLSHLDQGGTAVILICLDLPSHLGSKNCLQRLGLSLKQVTPKKLISFRYTEAYPVAYQRGTTAQVNLPNKKPMANFVFSHHAGLEHSPLINMPTLFSQNHVAVNVSYGQGSVVVMDSAGLPEDRADIVGHLLKTAKKEHYSPIEKTTSDVKAMLKVAIQDAFEIYEEIPLKILCHKAQIDPSEDLVLYTMLEDLIRNGEIQARIRGQYIIKA